jgi:hypothetical protein
VAGVELFFLLHAYFSGVKRRENIHRQQGRAVNSVASQKTAAKNDGKIRLPKKPKKRTEANTPALERGGGGPRPFVCSLKHKENNDRHVMFQEQKNTLTLQNTLD